jgi:hypothetical protein
MELGFFPTPHPDELLYSLCARYSERVQYPNRKAVNIELFGVDRNTTSIDLNCNLGNLIAKLSLYTADELINKHTLLPLYGPFLPTERLRTLKKIMEASNRSLIQAYLRHIFAEIKSSSWLRYCPVCIKDDKENFGETYWHRLHQVPCIEVCPFHHVFLEDSSVSTRTDSNSSLFTTAEEGILQETARPINFLEPCASATTYTKIASDAVWLLDQRNLSIGSERLRAGFLNLFTEHGMVTFRGNIRWKSLLEKFDALYTKNTLSSLQCHVDKQDRNNWLVRIVNDLKNGTAHHPLRYILLVHLFEYSMESFVELCKDADAKSLSRISPFGDGPWPCLNKASKHFRELRIRECHITHVQKPYSTVGVFSCACGFVYARRDSDTSSSDIYRIGWIKNYGTVWESYLRSKWNDRAKTINQIAQDLELKCEIIIRQALRLKLSFPRHGQRSSMSRKIAQIEQHITSIQTRKDKKRNTYRKDILATRKKYPTANRTQLRKLLPHAYDWLYRHNKEWLDNHIPSSGRTQPDLFRDYESLDSQLSNEVRLAVTTLRSLPDRPVRITRTAIAKSLGKLRIILDKKKMTKLPMTTTALLEKEENYVDFAIRRIRWAANCFRQENRVPTRAKLFSRAGVVPHIRDVPQVKAIADSELSTLQRMSVSAASKAA